MKTERILLMVLLMMAVVTTANATVIRQLSMAEIVHKAPVIFEGEVVGIAIQEASEERPPVTIVTFTVITPIKGNVEAGGELVLRYVGGNTGSKRLTIEKSVVPRIGEHGVYFTKSPERLYVHPLLGWGQGHFRVKTRDGKAYVFTESGQPVADIDTSTKRESQSQAFSSGIAWGVETVGQESIRSMTLEAFLSRIKEVINE